MLQHLGCAVHSVHEDGAGDAVVLAGWRLLMNAYSRLYTETEARMARLLSEVGQSFSDSERAEVLRFLKAGEYGLALETLSFILIEESKSVGAALLLGIDEAAVAMQLRDERFMCDLHNYCDRQRGAVV
jgi:hypothetical protein